MYDKRTPGLMKIESEGSSMFALCSKTYVLQRDKGFKLSSKGINKKMIKNPTTLMKDVLESQISKKSQNRGFRLKNNNMFTYSQNRVAFNYFLL